MEQQVKRPVSGSMEATTGLLAEKSPVELLQWNDGEHSLEGGDREVWGESLQLETGYCKSCYSDVNCVHK